MNRGKADSKLLALQTRASELGYFELMMCLVERLRSLAAAGIETHSTV